MVRVALGLIAGVVLALAAIMGVEGLSAQFFPIPANFASMDRVDQGIVMDELPFLAKALVLVGWGLAAALGGVVARAVGGLDRLAWGVAGLVIAGAVVTSFTIPHPLWMRLGAVFAPLAGGWIARSLPLPALTLAGWRRTAS